MRGWFLGVPALLVENVGMQGLEFSGLLAPLLPGRGGRRGHQGRVPDVDRWRIHGRHSQPPHVRDEAVDVG